MKLPNIDICEGLPGVYCNYLVSMLQDKQLGKAKTGKGGDDGVK
jgi:hypothetical protein